MLDIAATTYEMFGGLYQPRPEISIPTQRELGRLPIIETIAVDPEGAHEIDDTFAIYNKSGRPIENWTIIARGGLIPYTSDEFQLAFERLWSVYTLEEPGSSTEQHRPMIENQELVANRLSLAEDGELKPGLAIFYKLGKTKGRTGKTFHRRVQHVAVRPAQKTYGEFGEELLAGRHEDVLIAVNAIRCFDGRRPLKIKPHEMRSDSQLDFDPTESFARKIVQELMVQANKEFGRVPERANPYPRRVTRSVIVDDRGRLVGNDDEAASKITRAYYSAYRERHALLETRSYTHTTSPLRRFLDLFGHQIWEAHLAHGFDLARLQREPMAKVLSYVNHQIDQQAVRIGRDF